MKPNYVCVDERFCTEFGRTIEECINRYRESMDEYADISKLTFYKLNEPYNVEVFYVLERKS
jgi:hypothetical protein